MDALWMVLGAFFFSAMAVCVKFASGGFNSLEMVFWRGVLGMLMLWALARHQRVSLATSYAGMHLWRSAVGVTSLAAWFYAISYLPLATAVTLNYMSSVWIAAFLIGGALIAWNPRQEGRGPALRQGPLALTVLAGFAGVIMMLRPTLDQEQLFAGLVGLLSGLTAAFAYLQVMALGKVGEPELRTVFYFAAGSAVFGAAGLLFTGLSTWSWQHAAWLPPIAVLAALGQLCMTRAYSHGATLVVASLQYSGIVFGAVFSLLLFGEHIPLLGWLGMGLILASGIAATALRARAAPNAPAEEH
ncbi:DMT family transporter [Ramlibacter sp. AW1]|uniref:DMT family transporter n=1 Tax=Ramlibacter aurantiacus TaxID=2801330 RepID=A0A936ZR63_9BURK|nr:DMT family transporter [Ramlibacter aurantiacus]MBL0419535.1 DMT family transporter [Ramlibacter aurantiacus]